uniref:Uncharacterized protein n=1 Tax=Panagrolaimus sp. ES5 TaxID=591445 RepID=A0AC34EZX8_9BILA
MAPGEATSPEEQKFNELEQTLEQFQENARHMGVIASEFTPRSQEPLLNKIHTMVHGLRRLEKNRPFEIDLEELRKEYLNTENDRFEEKK